MSKIRHYYCHVALLIILGCIATAAAAPDMPAAELACGITDPRLANSTCDAACRRVIYGSLVGIYHILNGSYWNWTTLEENTGSTGSNTWNTCQQCTSIKDKQPLPSYCCWEGVTCCEEYSTYMHELQQHSCNLYSVPVLQTRDGNLTGPFDAVMDNLQQLHQHGLAYLDMSRNFLTGVIPPAIGELENLQVLLLGSNNITGTVPVELSKLHQLKQLDLDFNFLTGRLDEGQLCNSSSNQLQALYVRANNFTGPLNLSRCMQLEVADIQENGFTGPLPIGETNRQLSVLRARLNSFSGSISTQIWRLPQLATIDVTNNSLTGTLPHNFSPSVFLTNVQLGSNQLRGSVPPGISQSSQLSKLDLSDNPYLSGTLPEMKWMFGLQELRLANTLISGTIPDSLELLPYLEVVDIHNTRMTCCQSLEQAEAAAASGELLPSWLVFTSETQKMPVNEVLGHDDDNINKYLHTGQGMTCDTVQRNATQLQQPSFLDAAVLRPGDLTKQLWVVDPEYYWFMKCDCMTGMEPARDPYVSAPIWCSNSTLSPDSSTQCINMQVLTCTPKGNNLTKEQIVMVSILSVAALLMLVIMTSLSLNMCIARTGKIRRQLNWWHKHLAGMPKTGRMSLVVTDIEGYSDLFKRCPELMYKALTLHNNVIRKAKYANCGSTVQQEGDSYTLAFHDPFDAVAFCLQAQLALMEVPWPEGLMDTDNSTHGPPSRNGRAARRTKFSQLDVLLAAGPSSWLRKPKTSSSKNCASRSVSSTGQQPTDCPKATDSTRAAAANVVPARGHSRSRMLDLFRSQTSSNGGGVFNGLRVRMGVVTGHVEGPAEASAALANIMNSSLLKLAVDVSDAGNGGQILMDGATFARIKEELHPLGAVDANGLNYSKLAARRSLWHLLFLGSLWTRRSDMLDVDEAIVLDMGEYEIPSPPPKLNSISRTTTNMLRGSLKYVWPAHYLHRTHTPTAAADNLLPTPAVPENAAEDLPAPLVVTTPDGDLQIQQQLESTSSLPGAMPLFDYGEFGHQQRLAASTTETSGVRAASLQRQRVRMVQVLAPSLVGRAQVWGNNLSVKSGWLCTDAPYYEAPGAKEAPLGNSSSPWRTLSMSTTQTEPAATTVRSSSLHQLQPQVVAQQQQVQLEVLPAELTAAAEPQTTLCTESAEIEQPQSHVQVDVQSLALDMQTPDRPGGMAAITTVTSLLTAPGGDATVTCPTAGVWDSGLGLPLAAPVVVPPVTMVFMVVEGVKVFGSRRKQLLKEIHGQLSVLLMEALRHIAGGYLCRMQEGDLKYMVAFAGAQAALEWCLLVQEAAMYLDWDDAKFQRIAQLRSEYDSDGHLVFRGPRLKMGVCEGIPRTIIPDHLGRADYHGSSINQAARYMDAAAHGGQIACEAQLAAAVMAEWAHSAATHAVTASSTLGSKAYSNAKGSDDITVVQAACTVAGPDAAVATAVHVHDKQVLGVAAGSGADVHARSSVVSAQQGDVYPAAAAAAAEAVAACSGNNIKVSAASAVTLAATVSAPVCVSSGNGSAAAVHYNTSSSGHGSSNSRRLGSSMTGRLSSMFGKNSSAGVKVVQQDSSDIEMQQQQLAVSDGNLDTLQQQDAAASSGCDITSVNVPVAAATATAATQRMFGLSYVPRLHAEVQAHHIGTFKFKGNPQPLDMVNIMLATLAGRSQLFSKHPPKGKGNRLAEKSGIAGAVVAPLPTLAAQYRARVPHHILEHVGGSRNPKQQQQQQSMLRNKLSISSMPVQRSRTMSAVVSGGSWGGSEDGKSTVSHSSHAGISSYSNINNNNALSFVLRGKSPSIPEGYDAAAAAAATAAAGCGKNSSSSSVVPVAVGQQQQQ